MGVFAAVAQILPCESRKPASRQRPESQKWAQKDRQEQGNRRQRETKDRQLCECSGNVVFRSLAFPIRSIRRIRGSPPTASLPTKAAWLGCIRKKPRIARITRIGQRRSHLPVKCLSFLFFVPFLFPIRRIRGSPPTASLPLRSANSHGILCGRSGRESESPHR